MGRIRQVVLKSEMSLFRITEDIFKKLSNLKLNKSLQPDAIHPRALYEVRSEIYISLKHIIDPSLNTSVTT